MCTADVHAAGMDQIAGLSTTAAAGIGNAAAGVPQLIGHAGVGGIERGEKHASARGIVVGPPIVINSAVASPRVSSPIRHND